MTLAIEHYPEVLFSFPVLGCSFNVDLNESVQSKLKPGEQLTNATALKILKRIKVESDILSFLTKPIVAFPLSIGVAALGLGLTAVAGVVACIASLFFCILGGSMLGFYIKNSFNGSLPRVSEAYGAQSRLASEYIEAIKAAEGEITFTGLRGHGSS